jgi:hypothetical protein
VVATNALRPRVLQERTTAIQIAEAIGNIANEQYDIHTLCIEEGEGGCESLVFGMNVS